MRLNIRLFTTTIIIVSLILSSGFTIAQASQKQYRLKLQTYLGPNHPITKVTEEALEYVERMSDNRLKIKQYDSNVLAGGSEIIEATEKGVVDIGLWYPMFHAKTLPLINMTAGLPLAYKNKATCIDTWKGGELTGLLEEGLAEKGYKNIGIGFPHHTAFFGLGFVNKEIHVPSDLKGTVVMVRGDAAIDWVKSYGGAAISSISTGEVYEALTRGIIDGAWCTSTNLTNMKWMEPMNYYVNIPFCGIHMMWVWNKEKINGLPDDLRNIVYNFLNHASDKIMIVYFKYAQTFLPIIEQHLKVYTPTPDEMKIWFEKQEDILEKFAKENGERGRKAVEIIKRFNK